MQKCPACGFNNPDGRERCLRCSAALQSAKLPAASEALVGPGLRVEGMLAGLRRQLYFFVQWLQPKVPENIGHRFPWTAAYLAIFFGAGQLYNRQPFKALLFALIQAGLIALFIATIFMPVNDLVAIAMVGFILYAMADGWIIAYRVNGLEWRMRQLFAMWFALIFFLGVIFSSLQFFGHGFFYITTLRTNNLAPALKKGDKVFVVAWPLWGKRMPKPGAVVFYNPGRFVYEVPGNEISGSNVYSVNERNSFGVVSAAEGDVMVLGDRSLQINHVPAPPRLLPIFPPGIPGVGEITVPKDHVGILQTHGSADEGILAGLGGSYGAYAPNPRDAMMRGWLLKGYQKAAVTHHDDLHGVVLGIFYPPQRRRWFGNDGGIWREHPDDYAGGKANDGN